jgi:hypothetical protein
MGPTITINESSKETPNTISYEMAAAESEKEAERTEVCCNQLIKNLLMNNLGLLKLNEINAILLF